MAVRLLPAVCPLVMDPIPEVRQASLLCLDTFIKVLKEEEEVRRAREAAAAEAAGAAGSAGAAAAASGSGGATSYFSGQAPAVLGATSSMLTWAVSGLMNTVGGATPVAPGAAPPAAVAPAAAAGPAAAKASSPRSAAAPVRASNSVAATAAATSSIAADGWEDDDEAFQVRGVGAL